MPYKNVIKIKRVKTQQKRARKTAQKQHKIITASNKHRESDESLYRTYRGAPKQQGNE